MLDANRRDCEGQIIEVCGKAVVGRFDPLPNTCSIAWLVRFLFEADSAAPAAPYSDPGSGGPADRPDGRVDCLVAAGPGRPGVQRLFAADCPDPSSECPFKITSMG